MRAAPAFDSRSSSPPRLPAAQQYSALYHSGRIASASALPPSRKNPSCSSDLLDHAAARKNKVSAPAPAARRQAKSSSAAPAAPATPPIASAVLLHRLKRQSS